MKPRVYIETFGCQMNVADTERAATGLRSSGYELCDSADEADVVLLNTCSVREKAERKVYTRIGEVRSGNTSKRGKQIVDHRLHGQPTFGRLRRFGRRRSFTWNSGQK